MNRVFEPEECEVSDDEVNWVSMADNVGRFARVRPEVWERFSRELLGDVAPSISYADIITIDPNATSSISVGIKP